MTKSHLFSHTKKGFPQLFHRMQWTLIRHDHQTRYVVIFNFPDSSLGFIHAMIHAMVRQAVSVMFKIEIHITYLKMVRNCRSLEHLASDLWPDEPSCTLTYAIESQCGSMPHYHQGRMSYGSLSM